MILYMTIISISLIVIILLNALLSNLTFWCVFGATMLALVCVFVIDAIVAAIVHAIPEHKINPFKKCYTINKTEKKLYEKLGVKKWKDIIPESGKYLCHFAKDKVYEPTNNEYVLKFLRETCYAGIMHILSIFLGFIPLVVLPQKLNIVLPVCAINAFLQLLPVIVQRYNRDRLYKLYTFNNKHQREE